jgi:hypothetical protein
MISVSVQLYLGHGEHYGVGEVSVDEKGLRQGADFYHWIGVWCQTKALI